MPGEFGSLPYYRFQMKCSWPEVSAFRILGKNLASGLDSYEDGAAVGVTRGTRTSRLQSSSLPGLGAGDGGHLRDGVGVHGKVLIPLTDMDLIPLGMSHFWDLKLAM